jgi:DNA-binding response OmpR family regulator
MNARREMAMEKIKVLLVDDEVEFVETLSERILMRGLDAEIAFNGEAALQMLQTRVPDVMVLDLKMPGLNGREVLVRVRKTFPAIQVIILTGHGSEKDKSEALNSGAFDYLQKPVGIDILIQTIHRAYTFKRESAVISAGAGHTGDLSPQGV